jgi:acyl-coenzyme A thioesterase PaaI-like protein
MTSQQMAGGRGLAVSPAPAQVRDRVGAVSAGFLATFTDAAAAMVALGAAEPDWVVTADLSLTTSGRVATGPLVAIADALRAGSRLIVIRVAVVDGCGASIDELFEAPLDDTALLPGIGQAEASFVRVAATRTAVTAAARAQGRNQRRHMGPATLPAEPLVERVGVTTAAANAGTAAVRSIPYVRNSMGAITGGVYGIGMQAAAENLHPECVAADLTIRYLSESREGPLRFVARTVRAQEHAAVCAVEGIDDASGRTVSSGTVTLIDH